MKKRKKKRSLNIEKLMAQIERMFAPPVHPTVSRRRRWNVSRHWAGHSPRLLRRPHWGMY